MNFVESLSFTHMNAKEIPCVTSAGAPAAATQGAPGVLYMDTDTGEIYKCTAADYENEVFTWKPLTDSQGSGATGSCPLTVETITVGEAHVAVTALVLDYNSIALRVGDMMQLACEVQPSNAANTAVTWESGSSAIAAVEGGLVTALSEGNATITARSAENPTITATCAVAVSASESGEDTTVYTVTNNLTNVTSNNAAATVNAGASYAATLSAVEGYVLDSVSVTMGGDDITAAAYADGVVGIASANGNIVITATAVAVESGGGSGNGSGEKVQFGMLPITLGLVKADGTITDFGGRYHVSIPYSEGMVVSGRGTKGWSQNSYPCVVVSDDSGYHVHTVEFDSDPITINGQLATVFTATLSGYENSATVYVSFSTAGGTLGVDLESNLNEAGCYYYIPGGDA